MADRIIAVNKWLQGLLGCCLIISTAGTSRGVDCSFCCRVICLATFSLSNLLQEIKDMTCSVGTKDKIRFPSPSDYSLLVKISMS